jgi:hypothetical protein
LFGRASWDGLGESGVEKDNFIFVPNAFKCYKGGVIKEENLIKSGDIAIKEM